MTLKLFMAICILGLDVLIYFLFQWTLGEKGHCSRRRTKARRKVGSGPETELIVVHAQRQNAPKRATVLHYPRNAWPKQTEPNENWVTEEVAHRRRVRAFGSSKKNAKLAV